MAKAEQELTIKVDVDTQAILEMVKAEVLAERKRCAELAKTFMEEQEGYNFGIHKFIMGEEA